MSDTIEQSNSAYGVSKRLTPTLAVSGYTTVPKSFLDGYAKRFKITPVQAMIVVHLLSFKWNEKKPFPRLSVIADKMGLTESSVRSHLRALEKAGLVKRIYRPGHSNEFDLQPLFDKLEQKIASEPAKPNRKKSRGPNE